MILTLINEKSNSQSYSLNIKTLLIALLSVGLFSYQINQFNQINFLKKNYILRFFTILTRIPIYIIIYYYYYIIIILLYYYYIYTYIYLFIYIIIFFWEERRDFFSSSLWSKQGTQALSERLPLIRPGRPSPATLPGNSNDGEATVLVAAPTLLAAGDGRREQRKQGCPCLSLNRPLASFQAHRWPED